MSLFRTKKKKILNVLLLYLGLLFGVFVLVAEIPKAWLGYGEFGGSSQFSIPTDISPIHDARFPKHVTEVFAKVSCIAYGRVHPVSALHTCISYAAKLVIHITPSMHDFAEETKKILH